MTFDKSVKIPDVSFYQDANTTPQKIDFNKMKAAGAVGVIIRAGQNSWPDEDFRNNYAAAKAAGLPRGVYWFFDSRTSPMYQATLCISLIDSDLPELGVWGDWEENYKGTYSGWKFFKQLLEELQKKYTRVGVYTAPYYWMMNRPSDTQSLNYFKSLPVWIANYRDTPIIPSPWTNAVLWQWGTPAWGLEFGAESIEIDMNAFNGDEAAYRAYFGLGGEVPQSGETMFYGRNKTTLTNIRPLPNGNPPDLGDIYLNDLVEADRKDASGIWWHLTKLTRANGAPVALPAEAWAYGVNIEPIAPPVEPPPAGSLTVTVSVDGYQTADGKPSAAVEFKPL
jgi:GH25 family lysozyme M1 (1,4-beta-N-acetylmuramidase)